MRASDSLYNKSRGYRKTTIEVLPEVNEFFSQQLPYHKTQYEDIPVRFQIGFSTPTRLPEHQNRSDNPIIWQKNEVFESEPPLIAVDVSSKKKSTTDGYVKQYIDQSSSFRFGTLHILEN